MDKTRSTLTSARSLQFAVTTISHCGKRLRRIKLRRDYSVRAASDRAASMVENIKESSVPAAA
jgi:hypothetical protein